MVCAIFVGFIKWIIIRTKCSQIIRFLIMNWLQKSKIESSVPNLVEIGPNLGPLAHYMAFYIVTTAEWKSDSKTGQTSEASWYFEIWLFGSPNFDFTEVLRFLYLLKISGTSKSVFPFWKATVKQYVFTLRPKSSSSISINRNFEDGNKCWHNWHRCWRIVTCQDKALS